MDATFALLAAARFAHFAAACALFGLSVFPFYAFGPGAPATAFPRAMRVAALATLATCALVLLTMAANMGGALSAAFDPQTLAAAVTDTVFGKVWAGRTVLALAVAAIGLRRSGPRDPAMAVGSGLLLASIALTGHSALPDGGLGLAHRAVDAVHLLAAGWWIGGLLALVLAAHGLGAQAAPVLQRFSGVGYGAVAAIVLSGLFKSVVLVGSVAALGTAYGWTLLAKVALVAAMGALALVNRFLITPGLARDGDADLWRARLQRSVAVEFSLGLAVLAVAGALGAMSPPGA